MLEVPMTELSAAIRAIHGCDSRFIETVDVTASSPRGVSRLKVSLFDLIGHPKATRCYVWAEESWGLVRPKITGVLH